MEEYKFAEFGSRLKALREQSNIKQGQFADKIGIVRQSMSNYESGKHCPDVEVLKRMAKCLGCSVDYLLGLTEHKNYETNIEFDESLSILSKALCSIPEAFRNRWLDVLAGTAQWLSKDLNANSRLNFSAVTFFSALTELAGYCLEAEEKEADGSYFEEIASLYRCKRFSMILALRNELNTLDVISNEMIEKSKGDE
ncbi:MAG: helix-turn-helix domain-containing protein [Lachnospiraceae bacterium]|jgi:Predicted transcriptional regulators